MLDEYIIYYQNYLITGFLSILFILLILFLLYKYLTDNSKNIVSLPPNKKIMESSSDDDETIDDKEYMNTFHKWLEENDTTTLYDYNIIDTNNKDSDKDTTENLQKRNEQYSLPPNVSNFTSDKKKKLYNVNSINTEFDRNNFVNFDNPDFITQIKKKL